MNYKDTKPYMSAFLSVDLLTDFCGILFNRFYRLEIHSLMVCTIFSTQLVNYCPHGRRNYTCVRLPLYCTFSLTSSPLPPFPMYSILYTESVCLWGVGVGGVEMYCGPYSAGVLHSVSDQIQNLQNCFTTPNKNDQ
jgi:hypothetical protein